VESSEEDENFTYYVKAIEKCSKYTILNMDGSYHTRGLASRVRWRYTSQHDNPYACSLLQANAPPTSPTPTQTCPSAIADAGDFLFFGTSLPHKRGWGGVGRAARQGKRDKYR
jgi:hypothetical protein